MIPNNIIIKELKFELEIDEKSDFENVALNISELTNKNLIFSLQKDFDAAFKSDENISINSIIIDIGLIDLSNKSSIAETISNLLLNKIKSLDTNDRKTNESLIVHFIKFGFLPWWASSPKKMNDFLNATSFNQNLKDELYQIITKDSSNFYRLLNILNTKNKNKVFKKYLKNKFPYFHNSNLFFEKLFENFYNSESSNNRFNIKYELFRAFLKHDKENDLVFFMVLKKIIHNSNIQWAKVSETLSLKNNNNKKFSEILNFNEELFSSNKRLLNSELSEIGHLKYYILNGARDTSGVLNIDNLTVILSRLLSHDRESLKVIFAQLDIYDNSLKLFRVSKLLNIMNLFNFISLLFNASKSELLEDSFRFLKSMEEKGKINIASYFDFISIILNLKNSKETSNHLFYESLIKTISKTYNLRYNEVLIEFYFFSTSYKKIGEFEELIEMFYKNIILKETKELEFFMNQFKKSNNSIDISFLSNYQIKQFNVIKKHILYLNQNIVFNAWSNDITESFIFNQLSKQTIGSKNTFVKIIKTYSKKNNVNTQNLIIAILIKFFPKKTSTEDQSIEFLEYVLSINKPNIVNKFSYKEQQYLNTIFSDLKIEEKLELLSYNFNLKLSSTESLSNFDYLQNIEIKDTFIKQKIVYLIKEYSAIFTGGVKSKLNINQLTQIFKLEIKKNSINNKSIVYERVLNSIANISNVDITALTIQLLKRLVNKTNLNTYDIEFLNQINDSFFAFNSVLKTTEHDTNYFYQLLNKINDDSTRRMILNNYLLKSKIAVLKLSDKNYESLLKNLAYGNNNKNNNFIIIFNNMLSYLSYRKRIEFSSTLKFTALLIAHKNNLTDEEFLIELLKKINSMDSITYLEIKEQLYNSIQKISHEVDTANKQFIIRDAATQRIQEIKKQLFEKERDYKLLELKALKISENEKIHQQELIESNYKIALKKVVTENNLTVKVSVTQRIQELKKKVLEKERDYKLLELGAFKIMDNEKIKQQKLIESNYKIALKKVIVENEFTDKKENIASIKSLEEYESQNISLENSKDIILKRMSSYFDMPSQKYINTLSDKDFDYFLNVKKQINTSKTPKFLNFESFRNIEDIIKNNDNLLDFLNLYIDDFELLFEFAQASFSDPIKSRLASLIGSKNDVLIKVENYFLKLQKETLFSSLNTIEFKTLIRVNIIKKLVFTVYYKNQLNISAFTMDFIETLSKNQKINYKQTAAIGRKYLPKKTHEKQIIKGIVSFFDSNNFDRINKKIKEDELLKNIIHFFLITKKTPVWSSFQSLNIEDVIKFIKIKIKKSDSKYIKEILLNNKTAPIIITKLKKEGSDTQLEVLKLLEISTEKYFSISDFFESIIRTNSCSDFETSLIFINILEKKLWQKPSLLSVFDEIYSILKKHNIQKTTTIIKKLQLNYPNLKLIIKPIIQLSSEQKIELICYYIQNGSLTNIYGNKSSDYLQQLKKYSSKNKNQLKILLLEFSNTPEVSINFINVSSKSILEDLIIDELNNKNIELRFVFEKRIKSTSSEVKNDIVFYDLLINNIIAPKIIKLSNLDIVLKTIKSLNSKDYTSIIKTAQKLVSNGKIIEKNGVVLSYLRSIEGTKLSENSENKKIIFNAFIKELRYFVEFKSLDRSKEIFQINKLFIGILQFKSNLILKKQLHNWSKQKNKIFTLFNLFSKKEVSLLINFIHPKQLDCINNFNSILNIINYKPLHDYLNLDSSYKLTYKVLNTWSKQSIIINEPSEILYLLFEEILAHPNIDASELIEKLQNIHPSLNLNQKALVSSILKTSMNSVDEITEIASDGLFSNDLKDSIYVNNAGMIIIWPFLSTLCSKLGLLDGKNFIDDYSLQKAVLMLHYIVFGDEKFEESNLVLNKILCGASPDFFVDTSLRLNEMDKSIGEQMLIAVTKNWEKLDNTSARGLRESFLKREGIIKKNENNYTLIVEGKPFDMLLKTIPWNIMMIQTSFMDIRLLVEWKI
tara:strand:- start:1273 stop:7185 length:5913 start_codon:yes stop_codon:yes gene_type:complete